jgi:O-antigen/teichoic acid export membrane protein
MISRLRNSDFVRHGSFVFAGVVFANFFGYLFYAMLGRRLGVEAYGVVTSLVSAILVVNSPALVAQLICARLSADLEARGDRAALRQLADVVSLGASVAGACVIVVGFFLRDDIARYFRLSDSQPIVISLIVLAVYAVVSVQRGVLQGSNRFGDFSFSLSMEAAIKVVAGVWLAGPLGATGALIGVAAGSLAAVAYNVRAFAARFGSLREQLRLDPALIGRVISHVGLGQLTLVVLSYYDVPLVKHFFDPRSAGLYASAALVGRAILAAVSFVPTLIMPKVASRVAAGHSPLPLLGSAVGLAAAFIAVALAVIAGAPRFAVTLIAGRAFGDAAPLVLTYALASSCLSMAYVIGAYKMGLHRYDFVIPSFVAAVVEIGVISVWHPSLAAVVEVLAIGHAVVLVSMLFRVWATGEKRARGVVPGN